MSALLALALLATTACSGGGGTLAPPAHVEVAREGRAVVAEVNGRPVFADCVARQARAHRLDRHAALDECIGFELLAQEAERRGFATHPAARRALAREAVRRLLTRQFEARHATPADVPMSAVRAAWSKVELRSAYDHPEYRFCHYVRARVPRKAPRGGPEDREAEAQARRLYRALAGRTLTRAQLGEIVEREGAGYPFQVTSKPYNTPRHGASDEAFAAALFSIPKVGLVSEPTRTPWGWDIILLTRIAPERRETVDQAADEIRARIFEPWRQSAFMAWVRQLSASHHIAVSHDLAAQLQDPLELP